MQGQKHILIGMLPLRETVKKKITVDHKGGIFMSYRSKRSPEEKIQIIVDYLSGKLSMIDAAKMAGVYKSTIYEWVRLYQQEGSLGLLNTDTQRSYSTELKLAAVKAYLSGKGSLRDICIEYKIRSQKQLRDWIKVYNSGKDFKKQSGGSRMKSSRKTTQEERVKIVRECLESDRNYGEIAQKYQVSYQQVYGWVDKYTTLGDAGLEDRRGKRISQQEARTPEEELKIENAKLKHENFLLKLERDLLKKVEELERRDASRK